jgi:hypothetical protein
LSPLPEKDITIPFYKLNLNDDNVHDVLPLTFFRYHNDNVTLRLPVELTFEILEHKISENLSFYLDTIYE